MQKKTSLIVNKPFHNTSQTNKQQWTKILLQKTQNIQKFDNAWSSKVFLCFCILRQITDASERKMEAHIVRANRKQVRNAQIKSRVRINLVCIWFLSRWCSLRTTNWKSTNLWLKVVYFVGFSWLFSQHLFCSKRSTAWARLSTYPSGCTSGWGSSLGLCKTRKEICQHDNPAPPPPTKSTNVWLSVTPWYWISQLCPR